MFAVSSHPLPPEALPRLIVLLSDGSAGPVPLPRFRPKHEDNLPGGTGMARSVRPVSPAWEGCGPRRSAWLGGLWSSARSGLAGRVVVLGPVGLAGRVVVLGPVGLAGRVVVLGPVGPGRVQSVPIEIAVVLGQVRRGVWSGAVSGPPQLLSSRADPPSGWSAKSCSAQPERRVEPLAAMMAVLISVS